MTEPNALETKLDELILLQRFQLLGPDRIMEFPVRDHLIRFYLPFAMHDRLQNLILRSTRFFEEGILRLMPEIIAPGSVVLDAGANIGNHSVYFATICGAAEVHAFEPMEQTFNILQKNMQLNGLNDVVTCYRAGLGAEKGRASLGLYSTWNSGVSTLNFGEGGSYEVATVDSLNLPRLDFMKIDVEGAQVEMLAGAGETIARHKPLIWIELRPAGGADDEFEKGHACLTALGYTQTRKFTPADFLYSMA